MGEFRRALDLDSGYAAAHAGLGRAYLLKYQVLQDGQWLEPSREECRAAQALAPLLPSGHVCLGALLREEGDHRAALGEFQIASNLNLADGDAVRGIARAHADLGNPLAAESTYLTRAMREEFESKDRRWLGAFYADRGRFEESADQFEIAIELEPENGLGYRARGGVLIQLGDYGAAIEMLSEARRLRPRDGGPVRTWEWRCSTSAPTPKQ